MERVIVCEVRSRTISPIEPAGAEGGSETTDSLIVKIALGAVRVLSKVSYQRSI